MDRRLVSSCSSGLSNRIRCLANCLLLAKQLNRHIYLHWPVSPEVNKPFRELFDHDLEVLDTVLWESKVGLTETTIKFYSHRDHLVAPDDPEEVVWIKCWSQIRLQDVPWEEYQRDFLYQLQEIRPLPKWKDRANQLALPSPTYGCHIRIGDFCKTTGTLSYTDPYRLSTPEAFIRDMRIILEEEPHAHFYVATEFPRVMEAIYKAIPLDRIIQWPEKQWLHRTDPTGIEQALLELLILRRCQAILGSYQSQYSNLASEWGNLPMWQVHQDHPIQLARCKTQFGPLLCV